MLPHRTLETPGRTLETVVFSSIEFLFAFLPLTLAAYFTVPERARNTVLLVASLVFYTWGGGAFVLLLLFSAAVDYSAGRYVAGSLVRNNTRGVHTGIAISVGVNLLLLSYFKYANFAVLQLNAVGGRLGLEDIAWTSVALPIGISFYTFQSMSYTIDVARGRCEPLRSPFDFVLYVALFPQLIAGPIVRFHEIAAEIRSRTTRLVDFAEGSTRFVYGLAKKVLIADTVAPVVDAAFDGDIATLSAAGAWLGLLAFTVQIYFDFSGYSDMAIGLGRIFGFHFPENFRRPYSSLSITDFWRRWHITLSNWFRDYLYVPLGGNRDGPARTNLNLLIVFAATGIWHGAKWTFVIWGLLHGAAMLWERARSTNYVTSAPIVALARTRTIVLVIVLWALFRANSLNQAVEYFGALLGEGTGMLSADLVLQTADIPELVALSIGIATFFLRRSFSGSAVVTEEGGPHAAVARGMLFLVALPLSLLLIVSGTFSPFLYFQF